MAGLLYELEEQRDRTIAQYMQDRVQEALDAYKPMRAECDLAMSGHRSYPRSIITKDGELRLSIPKFRCSDGDLAIASAIDMTYGNEANHQLCQFHLLREYLRNIGDAGFSEALKLLRSESVAQVRIHAERAVYLSGGEAEYWCEKALNKGLAHLVSGQSRYKTTSLLERLNRELRRRERMGTWWNPHNLLVLLQRRGLLTSTT